MKRIGSRESIVLLTTAGAVLAAVTLFWALWKYLPEKSVPPPPAAVSAVRPERRDLSVRIALPAVLESARTVTVVAKVSGTLVEMPAEEGMHVGEGDVLARVDPEPYALELKSAEAAWLFAEDSLARTEGLSSGVSRQRLDEARASRDAALASYELARMRLGYAEIASPMEGIVLVRYADSGNPAATDRPLFVVGDPDHLRAEVRVPEKYWDRFADPENISVRLVRPYADEAKAARILRVGPGISTEDKTFDVVCVPDPGGAPWPIGSRLRVEFTVEELRAAWSLPLKALSGDGGLWRIGPGDSTAHRLEDPGLFRDGERLAVPEEWADSLFVLDGHHRLVEGQAVEPHGPGT